MEPRRRFRFLKELSEGAFGKVYLAEMITGDNFKSVVAIKLLHGKWSGHEEIVRRSRDEARVLGLLHHRNIIRVEDLTAINSQCAIVMEYLDGVDLKTLTNTCTERGERIPRRVVFEVSSQIAGALDAAYNKQPLQGGEPLRLIHRDIKPSNVMLTVAGDVKVLDFGTAQARFDDREAHTQALAFGSAAYMAPERLLGDPDAPSGDVFSLGITMYEMLSGEAFGKVHIRQERFDAKLDKKLEELDLSDLSAHQAQLLRDTLRQILAYESDRRPPAGPLTDLLESIAEEMHDGSIRRFCREVVAPIRASMNPEQDPNDPLTGSTVFEDSGQLRGEEQPPAWSDDPSFVSGSRTRDPAGSDARAISGQHNRPPEPPPAEIEIVPLVHDPSDIDGPTVMARPSPEPFGGFMPPAFQPPSPDLFSAPTIVHSGHDDDLEGETMRAPPPPPPSVQQTAAPASPPAPPDPTASSASAKHPKVVASTGPALRPPSGPPPIAPSPSAPAEAPTGPPQGAHPGGPPPRIASAQPGFASSGAGSSGPASSGPASASPASPGPKAAPAAAPKPVPAADKKGGGGAIKVVLGLFVVFVLLGGAGAALWMSGLLGGGGADKPSTPEPVAANAAAEGDPGGRVEAGPASDKTGSLQLTLNPPGQASVRIRKTGGFEKQWNGTGKLELVNLPEGTYQTTVTPPGGSGKRDTLDVKAGQSCAFTFKLSSQSWEAGACE